MFETCARWDVDKFEESLRLIGRGAYERSLQTTTIEPAVDNDALIDWQNLTALRARMRRGAALVDLLADDFFDSLRASPARVATVSPTRTFVYRPRVPPPSAAQSVPTRLATRRCRTRSVQRAERSQRRRPPATEQVPRRNARAPLRETTSNARAASSSGKQDDSDKANDSFADVKKRLSFGSGEPTPSRNERRRSTRSAKQAK